MSEQLFLDGLHYPKSREVELDGEIRSIHFDSLPVRFVVDVLVSAAEGGRGAHGGEEVQILGRRRSEIDESAKPMLLMELLPMIGPCTLAFFST